MKNIHTEHELLEKEIASLLEKYGFKVQLEAKVTENIRTDVFAIDPDTGRRLFIECKTATHYLSKEIVKQAARYLKFLGPNDEVIVVTKGIPSQDLLKEASQIGIKVWDIAKLKNEFSFRKKPRRIGRWLGTSIQLINFFLIFILYWIAIIYVQNFPNAWLLSLLLTLIFALALVASGLLKSVHINLRKFEASAEKQ